MVTQPETPTPTSKDGDGDDKPWCHKCGTDTYLSFESVSPVPGLTGMVNVDYDCTKCESFYGHMTPMAKIGRDALESFGIPYINTDADGNLHHGEAMTPTGERKPPPKYGGPPP